MSCTCGDATCNCLFVCYCQRDLCSCDLCYAIRETCCSICGLPFDTEGREVCQCFLESRPATSQAFQFINRADQESKDTDISHAPKDILLEEKFIVRDERLVNDEQHFLSLSTHRTGISRVEDHCSTKKRQTPEVQKQEITALIEGDSQQILNNCLEGNPDKCRTYSSSACNISPAFFTSDNVPGNTGNIPEKNVQSELVTHTKYSQDRSLEGKSVKSKECEEMSAEATAGQRMCPIGERHLIPISGIATGESISNLNETQFEVKNDPNRTFFSQKVPGLPFYHNEGYNFQLPHMPMWYAPRPIINYPPMLFLDYSGFHQYPQNSGSTEHSLTINRPPAPDVTTTEKNAYIQNWLESSNPGVGHGQKQDSPCSSATTEPNRNVVPGRRKITGRRFPPLKKTPEKGMEKRSSTDGEFISKKHVDDDNKTRTLQVDKKNSISVEEAENTGPVKNLSSTGKGKIPEKETARVNLERRYIKKGPPETQ